MFGFDEIILTSHYMEGYYEKDESKRKETLKDINVDDVKLHIGNEIYISNKMIDFLKEKKASSINGTNYVLFEMPFNIKPMNIYDVVYELLQYKFIPILAHPERYIFVRKEPEIIYDLIEKGVLMQANYGSIIGMYGTKAQIMVKRFLEINTIHFLGSDVHRENTIYPQIPKIIEKLKALIGEEKLIELSETNPRKVLQNQRIEVEEPESFKLTFREKMIMKKVS